MGRLLAIIGGLAWLGVIALIALALPWSERPRTASQRSTLPPLLTQLNAARPAGAATSWIVTRATSTHHVLVASVRAEEPTDARDIAKHLVEAVSNRKYDEVLIYVWKAGGRHLFADRRIQWTPREGYAELVMGD